MYSAQTQSWQIVNITNTDQVFASMNCSEGNDFPIGLHQWMFERTDCSDPWDDLSHTLSPTLRKVVFAVTYSELLERRGV